MLGPECAARWRSLQPHSAALCMGLLLWDPAADGASQAGLSSTSRFTSSLELQPGLSAAPSPELHEQKTSPGRSSPAGAVLWSGWGTSQWLLCASPVPEPCLHQMFQFTGPSAWQLSLLNLLFKAPSVLYPEGMEEQMQLVKSGFNSPA